MNQTPLRLTSLMSGFLSCVLVGATAGCNLVAFGAYVLEGDDGAKRVIVEADYAGLAGQSVAVLVEANEYVLYEDTAAPGDLAAGIASVLRAQVPDCRVLDSKIVAKFQTDHPHWSTMSRADVMDQLDADRLLQIELLEYTLNEPGNPYVWRGAASARASVTERGDDDADEAAYANTVRVAYPPGRVAGEVNSDRDTIRRGTLGLLSHKIAQLFYTREMTQ